MSGKNCTVTLTFGECAEHYVGMKKIGRRGDSGFSKDDLIDMASKFPPETVELVDLRYLMPHSNVELPDAYVLVVRDPFPEIRRELEGIMTCDEEIIDENGNLTGVEWDKEKYSRYTKGSVNSQARYNLCFTTMEEGYKTPANIQEKEGTVYNTLKIPALTDLQDHMNSLANEYLRCEGNFYYDIKTTYISFHGDTERMKVIGYRLGATFPLHFRWHIGPTPVSNYATVMLNGGDMYVFSEFASGCKKMPKTQLCLKHAGGFSKKIFADTKRVGIRFVNDEDEEENVEDKNV